MVHDTNTINNNKNLATFKIQHYGRVHKIGIHLKN